MSPVVLALLLAAQPVSASNAAALQAVPSTDTTAATTTTAATAATGATTATTTNTTAVVPSIRGPVGVGLLAAGAGLAAGGTVVFTFVEAVSTPDRPNNPPSAASEQFTTYSGFLGVAVASVSAVLIVIGAAITLADAGDGATAPP